MKTKLGQMEGNQWERYCQSLLRLRYQSEYQEVPAQFGGDLGIEGFTRSGLVVQCYCPDEDLTGKDLYEAQRDKITADINKLIKNASKIQALGAGTIKEWHFLTPDYNSRYLLEHCRTKEDEVLALNLPSIDSAFKIALQTEDDFIPERQIFVESSGHRIQPFGSSSVEDKILQLIASNNAIVSNINSKIRKLPYPSEEQDRLTKEYVYGYVGGQSELQGLNEHFPSTYRSVVELKAAVEARLQVLVLSGNGQYGTALLKVLEYYEDKLTKDFSGSLSTALIMLLSNGAVADWLCRCPLDFPNLEGQR